jgi:diguanylate cyclase (GGDEF)-like protein
MRVLIADDDVTSRLLLEAMVSSFGHECLVAADGKDAWEVLSTERVDVLLTEWTMPGIDGPELCRRVRGQLGDTYVYVVLLTGLDVPERVLEGMNAGADDYLVKPIDRFTMQARLVAAERVTDLQRQVADFRTKLEEANLELRSQSLTDALTGLGNRRRMEEDLARAHARALRLDRSYGVALFDIDHFKLYNDNYGHLAGDDALREVAHCLEGAVRAGETVYRYGGEEFLLLLPECNIDEVVLATVRICQATDLATPCDVERRCLLSGKGLAALRAGPPPTSGQGPLPSQIGGPESGARRAAGDLPLANRRAVSARTVAWANDLRDAILGRLREN